jgi:hypothetical protein
MGPGCLLPRMDQVVALEKAIADIGQWVQACRGLLEGLDPDQIVHELG